MYSTQRATRWIAVTTALVSSLAFAQTKQEKRFNCGPKPAVTVINEYGPVAVRPGTGNVVIVTYTLTSDKVEVDSNQSGDRIVIQSHILAGGNAENGRVDYQVMVPVEASVVLRSNTGPLIVEKLRGDITIEGANSPVEVREVSEAHVHIKTISGEIKLANIRQGHVEASTISGNVGLNSVTGPLVQVSSNTGQIRYEGDFGGDGSYKLSSHTGDIEASIPSSASVDVTATSVKGQVSDDYPLQPKSHSIVPSQAASFVQGTSGHAGSSVNLRTFSGKIRLKKR